MIKKPTVMAVGDSKEFSSILHIIRANTSLDVIEADGDAAAPPNGTDAIIVQARYFSDLQRSAITDPTTGVYNTRFFRQVIDREVARSERYGNPLSLLMLDLDGFKHINDSFGHLEGDRTLRLVAETISACVRSSDFVFRCGGDEFAVILAGTPVAGAAHAAEKILANVADDPTFRVTVSIGIAGFVSGMTSEQLAGNADRALYESKRSCKNCFRVFRTGPASE